MGNRYFCCGFLEIFTWISCVVMGICVCVLFFAFVFYRDFILFLKGFHTDFMGFTMMVGEKKQEWIVDHEGITHGWLIN